MSLFLLLKVRATDEVTLVNTVHRTYLAALSAAYALGIVNNSKIIYKIYCINRAIPCALAARNTTVHTNLAHLSTLVVVNALYYDTTL